MSEEMYTYYDEKTGKITELTASQWKEEIESILAPARKKTKKWQFICHSVFCTTLLTCIVSGVISYLTNDNIVNNIFDNSFVLFLSIVGLWFSSIEFIRYRVIAIEKTRKEMWKQIGCKDYGKYYDKGKW